MPEPVRASWDQMMNGSLDTQYAELEGIVTAVHNQQIVMLTEGGKITLDLDFQSEQLTAYEDALVRIRGCVFANFNARTHELEAGSLRVMGATLTVLEPASRDPFIAAQKSLRELLLYDPQTAPFRRLKISGQLIYSRGTDFFLSDGTNGMRVSARNADPFSAGDLVEAVGFLEMSGPAAELKEAVLRKTGNAPLPGPTKLSPDHLLSARYAGRLVQVEATLMNQWRDGSEYILDLQSGFVAFRARIESGSQSVQLPPLGSHLKLTGVYAPEGNRVGGGTVSGFQLLLHSPTGIDVLATPPWWTLKRVLILAGILAVLLLAALAWNKQLQRKVQRRGRQLEREIRNRQQAELRTAAEAERSRIARDLHD
jgi:signal transduction histidine kinase